MRTVGEIGLLAAFVSSGFAAVAYMVAGWGRYRSVRIARTNAVILAVFSLTLVMGILARALYQRDFTFNYVAQYSSKLLAPHYSLSALWVGQAGSLLLWSWFLAVLAVAFYFWPQRENADRSQIREPAMGMVMGYLCFLVAIMLFAANPVEPNVTSVQEGAGLSPLLQHPAMLIHPPVVFLGYATWTIPFGLAAAALFRGRMDVDWVRAARPWALMAWTLLGVGILLGAQWAYEELGWGGYWSWDPVENGSLIPWLAGTALIHTMMAWQHRGVLKKTALALSITTFGLCNFATFLTRSGIFSSLHAFSQSPIGWLFLALMITLAAGGFVLLYRRRRDLEPDRQLGSVLSREALIVMSAITLLLLTSAIVGGTLSSAISSAISERTILVGPSFYNSVLIPTGLVLLFATAMAPLLNWGKGPSRQQARWLAISAATGLVASLSAWGIGVRNPLLLFVIAVSISAVIALCGALAIDTACSHAGGRLANLLKTLSANRRPYSGFVIHMGFMCLALGVTGSSLGSRQQDFVLGAGQTVDWSGLKLRFLGSRERALPDKLVTEAELEIVVRNRAVKLVPSRHFHLLTRSWTTEVAIDSTWRGDVYVILHGADDHGQVRVTLVNNPMMRWIWLGGCVVVLGAALRLWPARVVRRLATSYFVGPAGQPSPVSSDATRRVAA